MAASASGPRSQIPNALTVGRLFAIPAFAVLVLESTRGYSWAAAIVFAGAAITDQIDGFLARRWHVESGFGKIADPLADRILIDVALVLLWQAGRLPWAALLLLVRDVVLVVATPLVVRHGYRFEVNFVGKLATWLVYASLSLAMIVPGTSAPQDVFWAGFALALVSLLLYARRASAGALQRRRDTASAGARSAGGVGG